MRKNVNDWERVASVVAGAALIAFAVKRSRARATLATTGAGLVARGLSGVCPVNYTLGRERRRDDTREALGGPRGIHIRERIVVDRPAEEIYAYWRDLSHLADVMPHIEKIEVLDDMRSHWIARGPAGVTVDWVAEIINEIEPELIAWRSLPGSQVASAGSVHFHQMADGRTEILVTLQYDPPAGKLGASLAWLVAQSPAAQLREDLQHFKRVFESGLAPGFSSAAAH
jgi:uncharacterized membrane protein